MTAHRTIAGLFTATLLLAASTAQAGVVWNIGVGVGFPGYYRPWYGCPGYCYYPRPVYVVPPPAVYVAPSTVLQPVYSVPPPPAVATSPSTETTPSTPAPAPAPTPVPPSPPTPALPTPRRLDENQLNNISHFVSHLTDHDEGVRLNSVTQLGRAKSPRAVDPLAATLAGDASPQVREAAAKALGLIGSPTALPALNRAVQADSSHDVRRTAQFSIEIIQSK
jgi:hypothetical protein